MPASELDKVQLPASCSAASTRCTSTRCASSMQAVDLRALRPAVALVLFGGRAWVTLLSASEGAKARRLLACILRTGGGGGERCVTVTRAIDMVVGPSCTRSLLKSRCCGHCPRALRRPLPTRDGGISYSNGGGGGGGSGSSMPLPPPIEPAYVRWLATATQRSSSRS